jgi:hypothetical protein
MLGNVFIMDVKKEKLQKELPISKRKHEKIKLPF